MGSHYKVEKTAPHWTEDQDAIVRKLMDRYRLVEQKSRRGEKIKRRVEFAEQVLNEHPILGNHKVEDIAGHFKFINEVLMGERSVENTPIKYKKWVGVEIEDEKKNDND